MFMKKFHETALFSSLETNPHVHTDNHTKDIDVHRQTDPQTLTHTLTHRQTNKRHRRRQTHTQRNERHASQRCIYK